MIFRNQLLYVKEEFSMSFKGVKKKRKPRGIKQDGTPSLDMCPGCYAFFCDPMAMSYKFQEKIRRRISQGLCPACGAKPCKCKSSLNGQKEITNPLIQIREFVDGTWSVVARIWNPQKKFYEHPTLINLPKKEAQKHCSVLIKNPPTIYEIVKHWRFIGD